MKAKLINYIILIISILLFSTCAGSTQQTQYEQAVPQTELHTHQLDAQHQQDDPQPASLFWTGDGGRGMSLTILPPRAAGLTEDQAYLLALVQGEFVSNFSSFSAIEVLDRVRLEDQYDELLSGYYSDDAEAGWDLGHLLPTTHIMTGSITRTSTGFALQVQIARNDTKMTTAMYSGSFSFTELDNLTGIRQASLDLLEKMGVTPTERTRTELTRAAAASHVNAQTALARGITAQRHGTEVEALSYYFQAAAFDPSLLEAASRSSIISAEISSNVGDVIREDILWRREWVARLNETEQYFDNVFKTIGLNFTLFYTTEVEVESIDYAAGNEKATLSINTNIRPSGVLINSLNRILKVIYDGLAATGRANAWELQNWPEQGVSNLNVFRRPASTQDTSLEVNFSINFELLNNQNQVIGRTTLQKIIARDGSRQISTYEIRRSGIITNRGFSSDNFIDTLKFIDVNEKDITGNLTIRITSINGQTPELAIQNNILQIRAISREDWSINNSYSFDRGTIVSYNGPVDNIIIPNMIWGEPVLSISELVFSRLKLNNREITSITIPDNISISRGAIGAQPLRRIIIGNNVSIEGLRNSAPTTEDAYLSIINSGSPDRSSFELFIPLYNANGRKTGTYTYTPSPRSAPSPGQRGYGDFINNINVTWGWRLVE